MRTTYTYLQTEMDEKTREPIFFAKNNIIEQEFLNFSKYLTIGKPGFFDYKILDHNERFFSILLEKAREIDNLQKERKANDNIWDIINDNLTEYYWADADYIKPCIELHNEIVRNMRNTEVAWNSQIKQNSSPQPPGHSLANLVRGQIVKGGKRNRKRRASITRKQKRKLKNKKNSRKYNK
jgi:hypothetical protein